MLFKDLTIGGLKLSLNQNLIKISAHQIIIKKNKFRTEKNEG